MKAFKEDGVALLKLKDGSHSYRFEIDQSFFEHFENSSLKKGHVKVELNLERNDQVFQSTLKLQGDVEVSCDNCLNEIPFPVDYHLDFVIKLTDVPQEDDEDREVYYVVKSEGQFFLSSHIYDAIYLALPIRKVCEDPGNLPICNMQVFSKMDELDDEEDSDQGTDPRWDKLKDLLN